MILMKLFLVFLKIGFCAVGGAYSFLPLLEKEAVQSQRWLDHSEFLEVVAMAEVFPGAISIKFATYTGYKVAGLPGACVANLANLLPPALFIMVAAMAYSRYKDIPSVKGALEMVQYAVIAMLVAIAVRSVNADHLFQPKVLLAVVASFLLVALARVHPALIILGAAMYGGLVA
jgi:chromate transporter